MIAFDALRTALLSDQPWTRLDELVRAELNSGRTTKQIFDELNGMWKEIGQIPGLSEDGKDAFGDTLDALTGMCHRDCQYKDPPNTSLPTEEEIAKLPRWARVAFAARCARRVLPLFRHFWSESPKEHDTAVTQAIEYAEQTAISAAVDANIARRLANDAVFAAIACRTTPQANAVARAAARSADVTAEADPIAYPYTDSGRVGEAVTAAVEAAGSNVVSLFRRDFDHLLSLSEYMHWTDDTPVPPDVFGPLWPEGSPKGWPSTTDITQRTELPLAFVVRDGTPSQVTEDDVVNLFNAMNRYHIARGGAPLTYEDLRSLLPALVPAEV